MDTKQSLTKLEFSFREGGRSMSVQLFMHIPEITSEEGNGKGCHQAGSKLGCYKAKDYFNAKDFCQTKKSRFIYYKRDTTRR